MSVVLGLLLAVLVMGCGIYESYGFDYKQLSSIERGMSFKEVCTILGEPAFRRGLDIPRLYSCGVVGCQGVVQRRKSGRNEELSGGYLSGYHFAGQEFHE